LHLSIIILIFFIVGEYLLCQNSSTIISWVHNGREQAHGVKGGFEILREDSQCSATFTEVLQSDKCSTKSGEYAAGGVGVDGKGKKVMQGSKEEKRTKAGKGSFAGRVALSIIGETARDTAVHGRDADFRWTSSINARIDSNIDINKVFEDELDTKFDTLKNREEDLDQTDLEIVGGPLGNLSKACHDINLLEGEVVTRGVVEIDNPSAGIDSSTDMTLRRNLIDFVNSGNKPVGAKQAGILTIRGTSEDVEDLVLNSVGQSNSEPSSKQGTIF